MQYISERHTHRTVVFMAHLTSLGKAAVAKEGVEQVLHLVTVINTRNMKCENTRGEVVEYASIDEIVNEFFRVRLAVYRWRKERLVVDLLRRLVRIKTQYKLVSAINDGFVTGTELTNAELDRVFETRAYPRVVSEGDDGSGVADYKYLYWCAFDANDRMAQELYDQQRAVQAELDKIVAQLPEDTWMEELMAFGSEWEKVRSLFSCHLEGQPEPLRS